MLTDEQKKLVTDNEKLIYYGINKYAYGDIEKFYGAASVELCRAAETFQTGKGTKFATYALHCICNEIHDDYRSIKRQKRFNCVSLDKGRILDENNSSFRIEPQADALIEPFEDSYVAHEIYNKTKLTDKQRQAFDLWLTGCKQKEIAQQLEISQAQVSRLIRSAAKRIRKESEPNHMLTEAQQKLVADNEKLIYYTLHKFGYPVDEFYDAGAIGLCKAATVWDPQKGSFANTAVWQIWGACSLVADHEKGKKKIPRNRIISFDALLQDTKSGELTLGDMFIPQDEMFKSTDDKAVCDEVLRRIKLSPNISARDKEIFLKWAAGEYTEAELGRRYGISRERVRQIVKSIKIRCQQIFKDT